MNICDEKYTEKSGNFSMTSTLHFKYDCCYLICVLIIPASEIGAENEDVKSQMLEAAKSGDLEQVQHLLTQYPEIVNCRDMDGRYVIDIHLVFYYHDVRRVGMTDSQNSFRINETCDFSTFKIYNRISEKEDVIFCVVFRGLIWGR